MNSDDLIRSRLKALSSQDAKYWEFRRQAAREGVHGLLQYPAMMVPQMQRDVLSVLLSSCPEAKRVLDPFVGSGTVMTESMLAGRKFTGVDINPLAILTCKAKANFHRHRKFRIKADLLIEKVLTSRTRRIDVEFFGRDKWFTRKASIALSRIRAAIIDEVDDWARAVFWTVMAETIRQTSNSRTSTYKLHIRPEEEIASLPDPIEVFVGRLEVACSQLAYHSQTMRERSVSALQPVLHCDSVLNLQKLSRTKFDIVVTSPPYGDNHSTIPYGQFSYLALNWISPDDLPKGAKVESTRSVDTQSLGGSTVVERKASHDAEEASPAFKKFIRQLRRQGKPDLEVKVMAFTVDFFQSIKNTVEAMDDGAYSAWTLGNRTVGGLTVPLTQICRELHEACGARHVDTVRRRIPNKRTPVRNSISQTMSDECLLLLGM
jgi:16S rRNA G966 N2-methylase RsmD